MISLTRRFPAVSPHFRAPLPVPAYAEAEAAL